MKKILSGVLCLCLLLTLAACGPQAQTRTVSLLKEEILYTAIGSIRGTYSYEYDDRGNLLRAEFPDETHSTVYNYTYDDHGYLTESTRTDTFFAGPVVSSTEQYLYTLKKGLPQRCQVLRNGAEQYTCSFRTNRKGLITRVDYQYPCDLSQQAADRWHVYLYDKNGHLLQESFCRSLPYGPELLYSVFQYRYEYDQDGNLQTLIFETGHVGEEIREPGDVTFSAQHTWEFARNEQGELTYMNIDQVPLLFRPHGSGICIPETCDDWQLDDQGNVAFAGGHAYVYETAELSCEDADRFDRWNLLLQTNGSTPVGLTMLRMQCLPTYHGGYEQFFYYYLIPNPLA